MTRFRLPLIVLLALALRAAILAFNMPPLNSDEAMIGLLARHIAAGERPVFYYGQSYYGPVDAYLISPLVNAFPGSDLLLRVVPLAASLAFVWAVYRLGREMFSEEVGLVSALIAAVSPAFMTIRGLKGDAAYSLVLLLGTLSLLVFHRLTARPTLRGYITLGTVWLVGFYIFPLMGCFILAEGIAWLLWLSPRLNLRRTTSLRRTTNLRRTTSLRIAADQPLETVKSVPSGSLSPRGQAFFLFGGLALSTLAAWIAVPRFLADLFQVLKLLFSISLPEMFGLLPYFENDSVFTAVYNQYGPLLQALIALATLLLFAAGLWVGARQARKGSPVLFIFITATLLVYALTSTMLHARLDSLNRPRFLYPLYAVLPLWSAAMLNGLRRVAPGRAWMRGGLLAAVLGVFLYGNLAIRPEAHPAQPLFDWLRQRPGEQSIYTDYWTGYWLAYASAEKVSPSILLAGNVPGWNRYPLYQKKVSADPSALYVFHSGSDEARRFQKALDHDDVQYQVEQVGQYTVYTAVSGRVSFREDGTMVIIPSRE